MKKEKMHHSMSHSHMYKEDLSHAGKKQGDMAPHVDDYQEPMKNFPEHGFSKTTEYVERQDSFRGKEAAAIRKQAYQGRYS